MRTLLGSGFRTVAWPIAGLLSNPGKIKRPIRLGAGFGQSWIFGGANLGTHGHI